MSCSNILPSAICMPTIVLVLAYPTFVDIDLNEVQDTGNCNDEVQTIEYKSCSKRLVLNKECLLYRSKDHFHWTAPCTPLVPKVGGTLSPHTRRLRRPCMDSPFLDWFQVLSLCAVNEVMPGRRSVFKNWTDYCSLEMEKLFIWNSRSLKLLQIKKKQ